jgi:hypothetical protein
MTKRIVILLLCSLLLVDVSIETGFTYGGEDDRVIREYDDGPCSLRYLNSGPYKGLRLWFGEELTLQCSFDVSTRDGFDGLTWIDVGGTVIGGRNESPRDYAHHVAFFDADDNLIICSGDFPAQRIGNTPANHVRGLPLPAGCHKAIARYKSAFYESDEAIGTRSGSPLTNNEDAGLERDKTPFKINASQRLLFEGTTAGVHVYTRDGPCKITDAPLPDPKEAAKNPPILIGGRPHSEAKLYLRADRGRLEVNYSIRNFAPIHTYHDLYVAFFDDDGRLIGSTSLDECRIGPKASSPSLAINGVLQEDPWAFATFTGRLPLGDHHRIASYKMTMYVYDRPRRQAE